MVRERLRRVDARGFSLVELTVVVAVIGILMVAGMPTFLTYWRTSTLKGGAQEVVSLLNQARQLAIKENESVCVKGDATGTNYGTKIRFLRGSCSAASMCATAASPCIWAGAGTDSSGYFTLSNRIELQAPATDILFTYLGAASPGGTYSVRSKDNTSATSSVVVAGSGRISYSFP